ncbi:MAG: hypothetical protein KA285_05400, partial [Bacteroidia bacterium]|nr:hypothetical protein [Bacteroidia bacterium]
SIKSRIKFRITKFESVIGYWFGYHKEPRNWFFIPMIFRKLSLNLMTLPQRGRMLVAKRIHANDPTPEGSYVGSKKIIPTE